jgi:hypothetical protein
VAYPCIYISNFISMVRNVKDTCWEHLMTTLLLIKTKLLSIEKKYKIKSSHPSHIFWWPWMIIYYLSWLGLSTRHIHVQYDLQSLMLNFAHTNSPLHLLCVVDFTPFLHRHTGCPLSTWQNEVLGSQECLPSWQSQVSPENPDLHMHFPVLSSHVAVFFTLQGQGRQSSP